MSTAEQIIAEHRLTGDPREEAMRCSALDCDWSANDAVLGMDAVVQLHAAHVVAALTNAGKTIVDLPEADGAALRTWASLAAVPHDVKVEDSDGDEFEYYPSDGGWRYTLPDGGLSGLFDGSDELGTLTEVVVPMLGEWAAARVAEGGA